ncbi:MAG TPA: chemotaxis protein CheW, partial [Halobacteriales archaeon]|nr:chemotaxis protein CheW [Halobacteriales archaeon]
DEGESNRVVVFDPSLFDDDRSVGWLVDRTRRVTEVAEDEVDESSDYDDFIEGIVKRDDGFIVWLEPRELHD